jgi:glycine cleavage system H protein
VTAETDGLRYSSDHCWARPEDDGRVTVGLTEFAQGALGAIVFAALPPVGNRVAAAEPLGEVESTKAVSELYAPIGGTVEVVNEALVERPGLLNTDPYGDGWWCTIRPADPAEVASLLTNTQYAALIDGAPDPEPSTKD